MTTRKLSILASAAALATLAACSTPSQPVYDTTTPRPYGQPVGQASPYGAQMGNVSNIELVDGARRPGLGAVLGAVVGAAVGNQIGSGTGRDAATVGGAVAGGVIGHNVQKRNANDVFRVTVRFDNGSVQTFNFERVDDLRVGDRVRYDGSQLYRA